MRRFREPEAGGGSRAEHPIEAARDRPVDGVWRRWGSGAEARFVTAARALVWGDTPRSIARIRVTVCDDLIDHLKALAARRPRGYRCSLAPDEGVRTGPEGPGDLINRAGHTDRSGHRTPAAATTRAGGWLTRRPCRQASRPRRTRLMPHGGTVAYNSNAYGTAIVKSAKRSGLALQRFAGSGPDNRNPVSGRPPPPGLRSCSPAPPRVANPPSPVVRRRSPPSTSMAAVVVWIMLFGVIVCAVLPRESTTYPGSSGLVRAVPDRVARCRAMPRGAVACRSMPDSVGR